MIKGKTYIPAADNKGEIILYEFSMNGEINVFFVSKIHPWVFVRVILHWEKSASVIQLNLYLNNILRVIVC